MPIFVAANNCKTTKIGFIMAYWQLILIYLLVINLVTFLLYGIDKWKAENHKWRIPESTLLSFAGIGGSIGAWIGMKVWHHKTLHKKFKYGVPAIFFLQIALTVYLLIYGIPT